MTDYQRYIDAYVFALEQADKVTSQGGKLTMPMPQPPPKGTQPNFAPRSSIRLTKRILPKKVYR